MPTICAANCNRKITSSNLIGFGLLNVIRLPDWAALLAAVLVLDFAIYLEHVLFHAVPTLWRLHGRASR